ncbi:hypothetical protein BDV41DRAFT_252173 [Aspergillus transmontanensis]|uniref:Uncharacterized protein n=1 Tax=Aspergillus transmontanensis TaxID=1034304 RepID=A0A5N6VYX9_9EURO|nr:hypothetical protein BDV41DRAFT_252173 [Aspergillus transmontanensis]
MTDKAEIENQVAQKLGELGPFLYRFAAAYAGKVRFFPVTDIFLQIKFNRIGTLLPMKLDTLWVRFARFYTPEEWDLLLQQGRN